MLPSPLVLLQSHVLLCAELACCFQRLPNCFFPQQSTQQLLLLQLHALETQSTRKYLHCVASRQIPTFARKATGILLWTLHPVVSCYLGCYKQSKVAGHFLA